MAMFTRAPCFKVALCNAVEEALKEKHQVHSAKCYLSPAVVQWGTETFRNQGRAMRRIIALDIAYLIVNSRADNVILNNSKAITIVTYENLCAALGPLRIFDRYLFQV